MIMADERIGRQTPTVSVVLPYEETRGGEAVLLYNQSSKKALEWQELMMYDIMAVNPDSTWRHMKFGCIRHTSSIHRIRRGRR